MRLGWSTPLANAVRRGHIEVVLLLDNDADPNHFRVKEDILGTKNKEIIGLLRKHSGKTSAELKAEDESDNP